MRRFSMLRYSLLIVLSGLFVASSVQAEPVKVTVMLSFSGVYKNLALSGRKGFELGIRQEASAQNVKWES